MAHLSSVAEYFVFPTNIPWNHALMVSSGFSSTTNFMRQKSSNPSISRGFHGKIHHVSWFSIVCSMFVSWFFYGFSTFFNVFLWVKSSHFWPKNPHEVPTKLRNFDQDDLAKAGLPGGQHPSSTGTTVTDLWDLWG